MAARTAAFTFSVFITSFVCGSLAAQSPAAATDLAYQTPPEVMVRIVNAPPTPVVSLSPAHAPGSRMLLIEQGSSLPSVSDLAEPELRLAGLRFNPAAGAPSRTRYAISLKLQALPSPGQPAPPEIDIVGLPAKPHVLYAEWSPDARHIALVNLDADASTVNKAPGKALSLYLVDTAKARATRVAGVHLNGVLAEPIGWLDSTELVVLAMPTSRGPAPVRSEVPFGPVIQENDGRATPAPTYEDLLKSPYDEQVFEFNASSQLALVKVDGMGVKPLGKPGLYASAEASPNGQYILVEELHRPFSYHQPYDRFPNRHQVYSVATGEVKVLEDSPLVDNLPIDRDAVEPGPREFGWRNDQPATVAWLQAADGGDPKREAAIRDRIYTLDAPFAAAPQVIAELSLRARSIEWGDDHLAVVRQGRWKDRRIILSALDPSTHALTELYQGSAQDRYHDPGRPVLERSPQGKLVVQTTPDHSGIYFSGLGASPKGDMPFVAVMPAGGDGGVAEKRIWQSQAPFYEVASAVLQTPGGAEILERRESVEQSPNYFLAPAESKTGLIPVTHFANPYAGIPMPTHRLLNYKRADGVDLTADLYLPPGYEKSQGPLPTLIEAYPAEFKSRTAASQVIGSPYEFTRINWGSPVFFTTTGYAVLANASIPIIGEGSQEPNDTYTDQLVAGAKAAIDAGVETGAVDRSRVAVMGHSYGAFMTANLLAHTDFFRAGIARSGAYNRSLTPFGFQNEERTYWQAPDVYFKLSPFSFADKIKTPILLFHGEADNNTGTFPIQSDRFYDALKGEGATVRFVLLPLEAHAYQGRENVLHMLWEMENWLDKYVKPAQPVVANR